MNILECRYCGREFHYPRKGKLYCSGICRNRQARSKARRGFFVGPIIPLGTELRCEYCGDRFTPRCNPYAKYCSKVCRSRYDHSKARRYGDCFDCGKSFPVYQSRYIKRCNDCHADWMSAAPKYTEIEIKPCGICGGSYVYHVCGLNRSHDACSVCCSRYPAHIRKTILNGSLEKRCVCCGVSFCAMPGSGYRSCSEKCANQSERASKAKRRKAAKDGETFDPLRIFFRDGWRCRHCGRKTPESKRGSTTNNAPELDHIVPLSAGGRHTKANTQLLCRRCNHTKGAGALFDQTLLFG